MSANLIMEEAINFADWIDEEGYEKTKKGWCIPYLTKQSIIYYTTEELYKFFLIHKHNEST